MRKVVPPPAADRLSLTFAALADPTRRAILARLTAGVTSVTALAEPHAMSLPAISKHLGVLERSGLIERGRHAQWRPCRLKAEPLKDAVHWLERYRQHWEESLDRLDDYLRELQAKGGKTAAAADPFPTGAAHPTPSRGAARKRK